MSDDPIYPAEHRRTKPAPLRVGDLIGIPYVERGDCIRTGLDCWGLVRIVLARSGVHIPRDPAEAIARGMIEKDFTDGSLAQICRTGDVLVFALKGDPCEHVAVALNAHQMIHATRAGGVVLGRIGDWSRHDRLIRILRPRVLDRAPELAT